MERGFSFRALALGSWSQAIGMWPVKQSRLPLMADERKY
jgi:hypothetical protein